MTLGELAAALELRYAGSAERELTGIAPIDTADETQLSFVVGSGLIGKLKASRAGAVILPEALAQEAPGDHLIAADPYAAMAKASWLLRPESRPEAGVSERALVGARGNIASDAAIASGVVIGNDCDIGDGVIIGANVVIGNRVNIGPHCRLFPGVIIGDRVTLGAHCRIQSGAVIGGEGFGYADTAEGWQPIHHTGGVELGNRVHVGANTTIDCGTFTATRIGNDVILDNQIQIAHNVVIGDNSAIAGCTGIAGSTVIGRGCRIGGACNIVGHIRIADGVVLNAASLVTRDIDEAGRYGSGTALQPVRAWRRSYVASAQLGDLPQRLARLERIVASDSAVVSVDASPDASPSASPGGTSRDVSPDASLGALPDTTRKEP